MPGYSKIIGTGSYFPEKILSNKDLEKLANTSDEWITSRTGIKERRIAENETTSEMSYKAAIKALEMAETCADDLDGIICASLSQDTIMPSMACLLQDKFGVGGKTFAFDLLAACSGFLYACAVADSMIKTGLGNKLLVIGAERMSPALDWNDRNTCILFGDGAGAAVIASSDTPGFRSFYMRAHGGYGDFLAFPSLGSNYFANIDTWDLKTNMIHMKGNELFKIAVKSMAEAADIAVKESGLSYEDIDCFVPHQANLRIIDAAAKRIKIDKEKVMITLDKYGNTSAASIPTTLDDAVRRGKIKKGDNVVSASFGGGLTWASTCFTF